MFGVFLDSIAQQIASDRLSQDTTSHFSLFSHFGVNSTGLSNSLLSDAYTGKNLSTESIINGLNTLNAKNNAGLEYVLDGYYQQSLTDKKFDFYKIGFQKRQYLALHFTDDLLGMLMLGNSSFEDQTAELNARFKNFNYQNVYVGLGKNLGDKWNTEFQFSAVIGTNYQELNLSESSLYTAPYGEYIDAVIDADFSTMNNFSTGLGGALSNKFTYKHSDNTAVSFGVYDLGMMNWSHLSTSSVDSAYYFDGFEIPNLFNPNSFNTSNLNPDSITSIVGIQESKGSKNVMLPGYLFLSYKHILNDKSTLEVGLQSTHYFWTGKLLYSRYIHQVNESFKVGAVLSYGGFGGLNVGFNLNKTIGDKLEISLGSRLVDGVIMYKYKSGVEATLRMSYTL